MSAPVAEQTAAGQDFRRRLLDGLAASIEERGYRDTTVADIVRHARTSKRTFYDHFPTKEQCFFDLLTANNEELVGTLRDAVDPARAVAGAGAPSGDGLRRHHRGQPRRSR